MHIVIGPAVAEMNTLPLICEFAIVIVTLRRPSWISKRSGAWGISFARSRCP